MRLLRPLAVPSSLLLGLVVVVSCGSPPVAKPASAAPSAIAQDTAPDAAAEPAHLARKPWPTRAGHPAPALVSTPMKGEPSASALAEARLVATTCEKAAAEQQETRIKEMRTALDESLTSWRQSQPGCWQQMQWQAQMRKRGPMPRPSMIDPSTPFASSAGGGALAGAPVPSAAPPPAAHTTEPPQGGGVASVAEKKPADPAAAKSASGTNNQVVGVDEADIVKTDGKYVYITSNGALRIIEALNPRVVSVTKLAGATQVREMFVEGDRAVVYTVSGNARGQRCTYGYDCQFGGDGTATQIIVLDIADRASPRVVREIDLSGSMIAARRIGRTVHTVVSDGDSGGPAFETWPRDLQTCGVTEAFARQKFAQLRVANEKLLKTKTAFPSIKENGKEQPLCNGLLRTSVRDGEAFTSVVSFSLDDDKAPPTTSTIESRPGAVFASSNALYLSVVHQKRNAGGRWFSFMPSQDEASEVHKFHVGASPSETKYVGSGVVPGHVLNQFAMDEWYGYLRVATTRGRVPDPKVESAVSILAEGEGGNLVRVGGVEHIAPGEDIRAVRFDDDRGYVVTFKKTDPLFVVDLGEPAQPKILGELKIPGFSTYIHRLDPDHLLSIGFDANDHGSFAYFDGIILQLFDVKDPLDPKLVHKEKIGTRGSSSQA
ncbi:MAG TPA: beta-propeller domain-containing protein, partial [Labilithrix sp.]